MAREVPASPAKTCVELHGFNDELRNNSPASGSAIATRVVEHFLDYFASQKIPQIVLINGDEEIDLWAVYRDKFKKDSEELPFEVNTYSFSMRLFKLYHSEATAHRLHVCARGREVEQDTLRQHFPDLVNKLVPVNTKQLTFGADGVMIL